VQALLRVLGARLPSPLYGELQMRLNNRQGPDPQVPV
jgi:hypothetical protein